MDRILFNKVICDMVTSSEFKVWVRKKYTNFTKEEKEDIVQDAVLKMLTSFHQFSVDSSLPYDEKKMILRGWIYRVINNFFINNHRAKFETQKRSPQNKKSFENFISLIETDNQQQHSFFFDELERIRITLHPNTNVVFLKAQGYKEEEIAKMLDIPLGTVKSRAFRFKDEIETLFKKLYA